MDGSAGELGGGVDLQCRGVWGGAGGAQVEGRCKGRAFKDVRAPIWPVPAPYLCDRLCLTASTKGQVLSPGPVNPAMPATGQWPRGLRSSPSPNPLHPLHPL